MKGFTLIETLVAVTIVTVAVSGAIFSANSAMVAAQVSRDRLTASYLAQEGVEYVRAMRDDAFLQEYHAGNANASADAWNSFTNGAPGSTPWSIRGCVDVTCTLDPLRSMGSVGNGSSLNSCGQGNGNACTPLYFANGAYTQQDNISGGVKTPFTRTIQATAISSTEESIVSIVTWNLHGTQFTASTAAHLTPWQ